MAGATSKVRAVLRAVWDRIPHISMAVQRFGTFVLFVWLLLQIIGVALSWRRWCAVLALSALYFAWHCFDAVRTAIIAGEHYSHASVSAEAMRKLIGPVLPTDAEHNEALTRFEQLKRATECMFARKSRLWASPDWDYALSLELNAAKAIPALTQFVMSSRARATPEMVHFNHAKGVFERVVPAARTRTQKLRREVRRVWHWFRNDGSSVLSKPLDDPDRVALGPLHDGFLFEFRGREYCSSVAVFGQSVRRLLSTLSALDPAFNAWSIAQRPMSRPLHMMSGDSWHFEWMHEPITVTSFAPCYGAHNSRYAFTSLDALAADGVAPEQVSSFVLLQPESSFVWHDMGPGCTRSETRWDNPKSLREKIRCKFLAAGREYAVAEYNEGAIPAAQHIVRTEHLNDPPLQWFIPNDNPDAALAAADNAAAPDAAAAAAAPAAAASDEKGPVAAAAAAPPPAAADAADDKRPVAADAAAATAADGPVRRAAAAAAAAACGAASAAS